MHFLLLPDDCLLIIFKPFTLTELLCLRSVCPRFAAIIEIALRSKSSLKLFNFHLQFDNYRLKVLQLFGSCDGKDVIYTFPSRNMKTRSALKTITNSLVSAHFPTVRQLVSIISANSVDLLPHWSISLVSLTLFRPDNKENKTLENTFHFICISMDSLVSLKQLHLLCLCEWTIPADRMGVLSRLEELTLCDYENDVRPVVARLDATQMKHLRLQNIDCYNLFERNHELASSLSHLTLYKVKFFYLFTYANLSAIAYLDVTHNKWAYQVNEFFAQLAHRTTLKELKMRAARLLAYLIFNSSVGKEVELNTFITTRMAHLNSVEHLHLTEIPDYDFFLNQLYILNRAVSLMFPSLKSLCIRFYSSNLRAKAVTTRITQHFNVNFAHIKLTIQREI